MATVPAELLFVRSSGQAYPISRDSLFSDTNNADIRMRTRQFNTTPEELAALTRLPENQSLPVHPAQIYASIGGMLLALLLNAMFYRRNRQGTVFGVLFLLYPIMRVIEEIIRIDNPHDTAGLTISQFISLLFFVGAIIWLIVMYRLPMRSPKAIPYVPPPEEPQPARKKTKKKRK
jgi:prolipoprotein diacylglyceryltransferase